MDSLENLRQGHHSVSVSPTFTQAMVIVITQGHEFTSVGIVAVSGGLRPQSHTGQQGMSA